MNQGTIPFHVIIQARAINKWLVSFKHIIPHRLILWEIIPNKVSINFFIIERLLVYLYLRHRTNELCSLTQERGTTKVEIFINTGHCIIVLILRKIHIIYKQSNRFITRRISVLCNEMVPLIKPNICLVFSYLNLINNSIRCILLNCGRKF